MFFCYVRVLWFASATLCVPNMPAAAGPWCERPSQEWTLASVCQCFHNLHHGPPQLLSGAEVDLTWILQASLCKAAGTSHTVCRKSKYDITNTIYYAHQYYQLIIFIHFDYLKNGFSYTDILSCLDRPTGMTCRGAFLSLHTPPLRKSSSAVIPLSPALPACLKW